MSAAQPGLLSAQPVLLSVIASSRRTGNSTVLLVSPLFAGCRFNLLLYQSLSIEFADDTRSSLS